MCDLQPYLRVNERWIFRNIDGDNVDIEDGRERDRLRQREKEKETERTGQREK